MDRKKDWQRTQVAYNAMVLGQGVFAKSPQAAITQSYNRGETDEFIRPYVIKRGGQPIAQIKDKDAVIFFNLRSDRARQLAKPFVQRDFNGKNAESFKRKKILKNLVFVAMTDFGPDLDSVLTAFPSVDLINTLPMVLAEKKQLYIAEKEKYAHITYFFNGGYANPVGGEDRILIPSPDVVNYDLTPKMSIFKITEQVLKSLKQYEFIGINFAIPDMVAHTGNLKATIKAVAAIDECLGRLAKEIFRNQGCLIITADHGNAERLINLATGEIDTEHNDNLVPLILAESKKTKRQLKNGRLADVAPTILKLMALKQPREMSGKSLF
jgi:2,3-bisphosphoglycerate-independent phosphoglycerate mutase